MSSVNQSQSPNECEAIREIIADYAFNLTDVSETQAVETGLPDCQDAVHELEDYRRIQESMRASIRLDVPSKDLRDRLLRATAISAVRPADKPRFRRLHPAWMAAAAAIVLLVVTNLYWLNTLRTRSNELTTGQDNPNSFVLDSTRGLRWARIPAAQETLTAAAFLMWNQDSRVGLMYAVNLPQLEPGRIYELWLNREGERVSVGRFGVDETGEGALLFSSIDPIDDFAWAWVTEEPDSGSTQPSDMIIARGEL